MKKNWTMRVGAGLLALTLITSCFVGGTFAKYTTAGDGKDSARVAKFGVEVKVTGDSAFLNTYKQKEENEKDAVLALNATADVKDNVVAPGTSSEEVNNGTAMQFTISGTPEVAVKVDVDFNVNKDIKLAKNVEFTDWTKEPYNGKFTLVNEYHPVKFTLKLIEDASQKITAEDEPEVLVNKGTLNDIKKTLNTYVSTAEYEPGEDLGATFELTWEWAFENKNNPNIDRADTLLGNLAADKLLAEGEDPQFTGELKEGKDYSTEINYDFIVTVTQID